VLLNQVQNEAGETKTLFAVCYERYKGARIVPGIEYLHAIDTSAARNIFWMASGRGGMRARNIGIVAIAPVIGYNVHDNHGDVLSV